MSYHAAVYLLAHLNYDPACCENKHCHEVPCAEIVQTANGWLWRGREFPRHLLKLAPDGNCHVCIAAAPVCIYLPPQV